MGIFLLFAMLVHEYMDIAVNIDKHRIWGHLKRAGGMWF